MDINLFDFELPEDRIALRPAYPRESAKLLVVDPEQELFDTNISAILNFLNPGDALIINNTRVIPTQLFGQRGDAQIGATLIKRISDGVWWAYVRNGKRVRLGDEIDFGHGLCAQALEKSADGQTLLQFSGYENSFEAALEKYGAMPLPPYIAARRPADAQDALDYQTAFAKQTGSVAAPTAGLHFTDELLTKIKHFGVKIIEVTLHVGAGTFLPIKVEDTRDHIMHPEWGEVCAQAAAEINAVKKSGGRIICVGTTSLRLVESASSKDGVVHPFTDETAIFITPGYDFKTVDILMTNFHLPKSTLFMLVSAFCGRNIMQAAYAHAITQKYRFYSYGDACLLMRPPVK
jgi:S-adenosylmethionine:tRNA ribosyltransferase-isomerase